MKYSLKRFTTPRYFVISCTFDRWKTYTRPSRSPDYFPSTFPYYASPREWNSERRAISACRNLRNKPHRWRCHRAAPFHHRVSAERSRSLPPLSCTHCVYWRARVGKGERVVARVTPRGRGVPFSRSRGM